MPKKTLRIPFKYAEPRLCRDCGTEVKKKDVFSGRAKETGGTAVICPDCLLNPKPSAAAPEQTIKSAPEKASPPSKTRKQAKPGRVADNDMFIDMILAAQEDDTVREKLIFISRLESFHRKTMIDTLTASMRSKGKKAVLLASAIECLKDDAVAMKTIEVLTGK